MKYESYQEKTGAAIKRGRRQVEAITKALYGRHESRPGARLTYGECIAIAASAGVSIGTARALLRRCFRFTKAFQGGICQP